MSGTENEAVRSEAIEAGGRAIGEAAAASNYEADWPDMAAAAYDAMREVIAREAIAGVCRREGHDEANVTTYGDGGTLRFMCARCGAKRSEPRDKWANGGYVLPAQPTALFPGEQIITEEPK